MNIQTTVELFTALSLLIAGLLTLTFRNRQSSFIGFRIGYTYNSERAWRKANTFAGVFSIAYSLFLLLLALLGVSLGVFIVITMVFVLAEVFLDTWIARREYELEELSREAPEKPPGERIEVHIKPYLLIQLAFLGLYLLFVVLNWSALPEPMAVHFSASGRPNGFMSRAWGAVGVPVLVWAMFFGLTLLGRDPGFFARMRGFSPTGWEAWAEFNTLMSLGLIVVSSIMILYNLKAIPREWVSYSAWMFLALGFFGIYMLAKAK
ncbi:DUF1648 domain-containing protein [Thermococcus sp.]|uniref:DUF1648 domain-containing protein n=1 Tax=Thermococcus sp. TaxID=35749 RepID=UPI0025E28A1F|nr:DUF1648 domain-containing protein [Thermococcus sp.]